MIRLIAAIDSNGGIAKNGRIPWHISNDLQYFNRLTRQFGANVLMGHSTLIANGRPLPNRQNFVVSHKPLDNKPEGVIEVPDLAQFIKDYKSDLWIIGGQEIFTQTIKYADELYLTKINHDFDCDKFFPEYEQNFKLVSSQGPFTANGLTYTFNLFVPKD